jgi:hypothetical protein
VNTIIRNNIANTIDLGGQGVSVNTNNMVRSGATGGNFTGTPSYVGGATPSTWQGFRLNSGSPGEGAATDGTNVGSLFFNPPAPSNFGP